jgi:hypothetical protein
LFVYLLFLIKSFKAHKNPGNLLIASCAHWLLIVGVLFVAMVCGYRSLLWSVISHTEQNNSTRSDTHTPQQQTKHPQSTTNNF